MFTTVSTYVSKCESHTKFEFNEMGTCQNENKTHTHTKQHFQLDLSDAAVTLKSEHAHQNWNESYNQRPHFK